MHMYQSHKRVLASKIAAIEIGEDGHCTIAPAESDAVPFITVDPTWRQRFKGTESDLGYFVQYEGGYTSWSPSQPFEAGYTRLENDTSF